MPDAIPWTSNINFASALLLHSCITVLLKEFLNILEITRRLCVYYFQRKYKSHAGSSISFSFVLDGYTSILSNDVDGEQSELYFTNTGLVLLATSLAGSVIMNLYLADFTLNMMVATTFGVCFITSLVVGKAHYTRPILALRRAGRFIWSDTPFVNFFTLVYIATVLKGAAQLRLQDYVTFRSIAVLELAFMKAKLAASPPKDQEKLMHALINSEMVYAQGHSAALQELTLQRDKLKAFTTIQRLSVMLIKTSIGYVGTELNIDPGIVRCSLPEPGQFLFMNHQRLKVCRWTKNVVLIVDNLHKALSSEQGAKNHKALHGILLRRLGKVRVIYAVRTATKYRGMDVFQSNPNLVTGVSETLIEGLQEGDSVLEMVFMRRG